MRLSPFLALALLPALAQAAPGVNIRWHQCLGDGGTPNRTFACDTNTGSEVVVCSFVLGTEIPQAVGLEVTLDVEAAVATLPAWWAFKNPGTCRQLSLGMSTMLPPTAVACTDWSGGQSVGGISAYQIGQPQANGAVLQIATAMPAGTSAHLFPGSEYFSCNVIIDHAGTVGTGACAGCSTPMCIEFFGVKVMTPVAGEYVFLGGPTDLLDTIFVTWQSPLASCQRTPTLRSTWGAVKALYR